MESQHSPQLEKPKPYSIRKVCELFGSVCMTSATPEQIEENNPMLRQLTIHELAYTIYDKMPAPVMPNRGMEMLLHKYVDGLSVTEFSVVFVPGQKVCIFPIPCNEGGDRYSFEDKSRCKYIHLIILDPKTNRVATGWPTPSSPVFNYLPHEVQTEMSFIVPENVSRDEIRSLITAAYRRGQFYFNDAGKQPDKH